MVVFHAAAFSLSFRHARLPALARPAWQATEGDRPAQPAITPSVAFRVKPHVPLLCECSRSLAAGLCFLTSAPGASSPERGRRIGNSVSFGTLNYQLSTINYLVAGPPRKAPRCLSSPPPQVVAIARCFPRRSGHRTTCSGSVSDECFAPDCVPGRAVEPGAV